MQQLTLDTNVLFAQKPVKAIGFIVQYQKLSVGSTQFTADSRLALWSHKPF